MKTFSAIFVIFTFFSYSALSKVQTEWRAPRLENQVYMQTDEGLVIIELAPFIAPNHVKRFKNLVNEGYYDGLDFYRVIDGFVAQAGDVDEKKPTQFNRQLAAEFTRSIPPMSAFQLEQKNDFMAPETGYLHEFPAGRDLQTKEEWLLHCPGNVAMAREVDKDSASTHFYIVIGQATRHLDRNMSSFGQVIYGMHVVQSLKRAHVNVATGLIEKSGQRSKIQWIKMAENIAPDQRIKIEIQKQDSKAFQERLRSSRNLENEFFHFKGNGNLDMCYYKPKAQIHE
ncbi:peptidylprolyl isomerase [Aliiglaciecola sp. 3_MG-2023]|uniref:peptidylprolyl isomerase n=1 Tax=Aliiglaciecola sp. 3_MG-2023 TaxID=3062644 RepID=UPI0026E243BD|nr:peptidylprolyl isomerase [Aliiglaciecola sp. 3_MG-2023]MDO6692404.1 peptidylprolyl isomerase [Aliiglaciecola sp. 3_MG-2023]